MDTFLQPAVGPDGKKKEFESNVLLAAIENMQYAVTVDVLNTVFSSLGAVQKIAIFEKNGGTQALIQYSDVATATLAKEALEGHCIYDGGYCKLHISYSRHTDLNIKAYSDKSRDYTIPLSLTMQQTPGVPKPPAQGQPSPTWDPAGQTGRPPFVSDQNTYHGQIYASAPLPNPAYAATTIPPWVGAQPVHLHPGGVSIPGQPPYSGS